LKVLKDAGSVVSQENGQEVFYQLDRSRIVVGLRQIAGAIKACCTA
jgi:hypothetical protein